MPADLSQSGGMTMQSNMMPVQLSPVATRSSTSTDWVGGREWEQGPSIVADRCVVRAIWYRSRDAVPRAVWAAQCGGNWQERG